MNIQTKNNNFCPNCQLKHFLRTTTIALVILILGLLVGHASCLSAQPSTQSPPQLTLEGTLTMYKVTRYGDSLQEIDRYRKTTKEGEYVAFILKTDKKMNVTQFIETEEELKVLVEYAESDETMQSEFLLVPNWDVFESFSEKDFAAQFAHKRVRVTGTFFFPMGGWHYVTPVAMEYSKVEVVEPNLPVFLQKFPPKTIHVNDSVELTFSSMEEAEWKLLHVVPHEDFYNAFVQVLMSDPSSMDYPFDSLTYNDPSESASELSSIVWSEDRNMRCIGLTYYTPSIMVQYRVDGRVRLAEANLDDNSYWCQCPDTVYTLPTDHSTLYLVRGYDGSVSGERNYCLQAYELDETGFHPAFVFEEGNPWNPNGAAQNIYMIICDNEETTNAVFNGGLSSLVYFDGKENAVCVRVFNEKEPDADGCTLEMTNRYRKYVWDGRRFVLKR